MAEQDNEKHLDQLLDALLATDSDVQPRPGLQTRILANVRAQTPQPSRPWSIGWIWAGAAIASVALAAALLVSYFGPTVPPPPSLANRSKPVIIPVQTGVAQPPSAVHARGGVEALPAVHGSKAPEPAIAMTAPDVRQEVFPAPTPISEQERLLLGYLAGTPQQEVIAQSRPERPVLDEGLESEPSPEVQPLQHSNSTR